MSDPFEVVLKELDFEYGPGVKCSMKGCIHTATHRGIHIPCNTGPLYCATHAAGWEREARAKTAYYFASRMIKCGDCGNRIHNNSEWVAKKI